MTPVLGPAPCGDCRTAVFYFRGHGWMELAVGQARTWQAHRCRRGGRCGLTLRNGDRCARRFGHRSNHSSRWAMDNSLRQWRAKRAAA